MDNSTVRRCLEESSHWDKDYRYMAMSDLATQLGKNLSMDTAMEKRIMEAILQRLDKDTSPDVHTVAVRCLSDLLRRAQTDTVTTVCEQLSKHLLDDEKEDLRDVYAIGLRKLIQDVPSSMGRVVVDQTVEKLVRKLRGGETASAAGGSASTTSVRIEVLDVLEDLLKRFGSDMESHANGLMETLLTVIQSSDQGARKRATSALASLTPHLSDELLNTLADSLLAAIESSSGSQRATMIQALSTVSGRIGWRLATFLPRIVPLLDTSLGTAESTEPMSDDEAALRESCFHAFESFLARCPGDMSPYLEDVMHRGISFMKFDPNYVYPAEDDDSGGGGESKEAGMDDDDDNDDDDEEGFDYDDDEDEFYEDEGFEDDEDSSWKVRRAAVRTLQALVASHPEHVRLFYQQLAPHFIGRFKEREENVRVDILRAFSELLRATVIVEGSTGHSMPPVLAEKLGLGMSSVGSAPATSSAGVSMRDTAAAMGILQPPALRRQKSSVDELAERLPEIVKHSLKQLTAKPNRAVTTKSAVLEMYRELVLAAGNRLATELPRVIRGVLGMMEESNAHLRLEALQFLRLVLDTSDNAWLPDMVDTLVPVNTQAAADGWYKISAEALRVIGRIALAVRPRTEDGREFRSMDASGSGAFTPTLFDAIMGRLQAHDIDQEVKEAAISSMGLLVSTLGDIVNDRLNEVWPLLLDRLRNEITRMAVLKALWFIALSPLRVDMSPILNDVLRELASLLRQKSRQLRQATLSALEAVMEAHGSSIDTALIQEALEGASLMIAEEDMFLAHLSLQLASTALQSHPGVSPVLQSAVLPRAETLASSSVLQGAALRSLQHFFRTVARIAGKDVPPKQLADAILRRAARVASQSSAGAGGKDGGEAPATGGLSTHKQAIHNAARCVAVLIQSATSKERDAALQSFLRDIRSDSVVDQLLALYCVSELGAVVDTAVRAESVFDDLLRAFDAPSEDVKTASSIALGGVATGSPNSGIPFLLQHVHDSTYAYLVLVALKETLLRHAPMRPGGPRFDPHVDTVQQTLFRLAETEEEGVRNMVAECIGRLACVAPQAIVPRIRDLARSSESAHERWTSVTALRYALPLHRIAGTLDELVTACLQHLMDEDLTVRHAALRTLNALVHETPQLVKPLLYGSSGSVGDVEISEGGDNPMPRGAIEEVGILRVVYAEMLPRKELQREVDLGPFKHKVDDGLPLRKEAFAIMESMLDRMQERVGLALLPRLCQGLRDVDDVRMLSFQLLVKLVGIPVWQRNVVGELPRITEALQVTFTGEKSARGKKQAPGQDIVRAGVRALDAIQQHCPDAMSVRPFADLVQQLEQRDATSAMLSSLRENHTATGAGAAAAAGAGAAGL